MSTFSDLGLSRPLLRAVEAQGYTTPTPIQEQAIPPLLEGRDLLGVAQTGTGKTAAFTLPLLHRFAERPRRPGARSARCLVLTPTRELAIQIHDSFGIYGRNVHLRRAVVYGGVGQRPQVKTMSRGVDVLVATPGRLLDLIGQGHISLDGVEAFVLDEADRMLDMGFIHDVKKIIARLPEERQTLLFSATMPDAITGLAGRMLRDYTRVEITPTATTVDRIDQHVLFVGRGDKKPLLDDLLRGDAVERSIVFTRTKRGANRVAEFLNRRGLSAEAIHGNKSQSARQRALAGLRDGRVRTLVATDIAARGIDVDGITHVINFDLPNEPESYVHRIGRTARAGSEGVALSFCDGEEVDYLHAIEKTIRQRVPIHEDHDWHCDSTAERHRTGPTRGRSSRGGGGRGRGAGRGNGGGRQGGRRRRRGGRPNRSA
ncbi:MAG: DEAD/DEAH box helicase [Myxococcota bacterium]